MSGSHYQLKKIIKPALLCFIAVTLPRVSAQISGSNSAASEFALGQQFARKEQFISAVKHFNYAIAAAPQNPQYHYARGVANLHLKCTDEALKDLEFCHSKNPDFPIHAKLWAAAYRAADRFPEAIEQFTVALKYEPKKTQADIYYDRAQTYLEHDKYQLAASDYTSAIALRPYEERYYRERAKCHEACKNYAEALRDYQLSQKLYPGNMSILMPLALCYAELGRFKESIDTYTQAIKAKPNDAKGYAMRAKTYDQMGNKELAEKDRNRARDLAENFNI